MKDIKMESFMVNLVEFKLDNRIELYWDPHMDFHVESNLKMMKKLKWVIQFVLMKDLNMAILIVLSTRLPMSHGLWVNSIT